MSAILPGPPSYPGDLNPLAAAAANAANAAVASAGVAAQKAQAATVDAAAVAAAAAQAVPDAATIAALVEPAQTAAVTVSDLVEPAQTAAATIGNLVEPAQTDRNVVGTLRVDAQADRDAVGSLAAGAQSDRNVVGTLRVDAQADASATLAAKDAANAAYSAITGVPLRVDAAQALNETQRAQGRENIGIGMPGGCAYSSGTHTPASAIALTDFEAHAEMVSATSGTLFSIVHGGVTYAVSVTDARFGTARWRGISYVSATGVLTLLADGVAHATSTALTAGPVTVAKVGDAISATLRSAVLYNRALTADERLQVMRGETPVGLATPASGVSLISGESSTFTNTVGTWLAYSGNGESIVASGGKLVCTGSSVITWCNQWYNGGVGLPRGSYRATFKARRVSGTIPGLAITTPYDGGASIDATVATITDAEATYTAIVTLTKFSYIGINPTAGSSAGCVYELDDISIVALGAVARYEPQNVTARGRWIDSSGNGYDLLPGAGVSPLKPRVGASRVIAATVSGSTVAAGTVASVGALTGATPSDIAAIAAVRQWDAISATWGQARPANAGALIPTATANGTVSLETSAHTSAVTVSAGTAVSLIHHIA